MRRFGRDLKKSTPGFEPGFIDGIGGYYVFVRHSRGFDPRHPLPSWAKPSFPIESGTSGLIRTMFFINLIKPFDVMTTV